MAKKTCPVCAGSGVNQLTLHDCRRCGGTGKITEVRTKTATIKTDFTLNGYTNDMEACRIEFKAGSFYPVLDKSGQAVKVDIQTLGLLVTWAWIPKDKTILS
jgi:RecJ-like exonuclease